MNKSIGVRDVESVHGVVTIPIAELSRLTTENERLRAEVDSLNSKARDKDMAYMAVEAERDAAVAECERLELKYRKGKCWICAHREVDIDREPCFTCYRHDERPMWKDGTNDAERKGVE